VARSLRDMGARRAIALSRLRGRQRSLSLPRLRRRRLADLLERCQAALVIWRQTIGWRDGLSAGTFRERYGREAWWSDSPMLLSLLRFFRSRSSDKLKQKDKIRNVDPAVPDVQAESWLRSLRVSDIRSLQPLRSLIAW